MNGKLKSIRGGGVYIPLLLLLLLLSINSKGQKAEKQQRFYFGFHFNATQSFSPRIKPVEGNQELKPAYHPGYEYGPSFNYRIKERHIISFKYSWGIYNHAYQFDIAAEDNPFAYYSISEKRWSQFPRYRKASLVYEYAAFWKPNTSLNISGGFSMYRTGTMTERYTYTLHGESDTTTATVFELYLQNHDQKPYYSANLGVAYYTSIFRKKDLRIGLDYNYSFRNWLEGFYVFWRDYPNYTWGYYAVRGHMFNLAVSYLLTGRKKEK